MSSKPQHPPMVHTIVLNILRDLEDSGQIEGRDRETFGRVIEGHVLAYMDEVLTQHERQINDLKHIIDDMLALEAA